MATETMLTYWHYITETSGTTWAEMAGTMATELSTQPWLAVNGLQSHDPIEPAYTLSIDAVPLLFEPTNHFTHTLEWVFQKVLIDQTHHYQVQL